MCAGWHARCSWRRRRVLAPKWIAGQFRNPPPHPLAQARACINADCESWQAVFAIAADTIAAIGRRMNFYQPTGPLSGVTNVRNRGLADGLGDARPALAQTESGAEADPHLRADPDRAWHTADVPTAGPKLARAPVRLPGHGCDCAGPVPGHGCDCAGPVRRGWRRSKPVSQLSQSPTATASNASDESSRRDISSRRG